MDFHTLEHRWKEASRRPAVKNGITFCTTVCSALLYAFVIQSFVRPAELLSGGFTGLAILIDMVTSRFGISFPTSLGMLCFNIPVGLLCSRAISRRFTFFSLLNVVICSFALQFFRFPVLFDDPMLDVIFGGVLNGMACVIALKGNASSGGTDFIALYVSNKTGRSIWTQIFVANCILYCVFGILFGWMNAAYSILFQFVTTRTISTFHHRFDRVTLQITTMKKDEILRTYIAHFEHGISWGEITGGYSGKKMYLMHTVTSAYEAHEAVELILEADPGAIINVMKTSQFYGKFYQAPMD
ncbi:MAG: YitT family protein [Clostridium sp.]|nr:YitT family protein [Clostridium sp.]